MLYSTWEPIYKEIIADFGFSEKDDQLTAVILDSILKNHPRVFSFSDIFPVIKDKEVVIIGAGSSVSDQIKSHKKLIQSSVCISADGATSAMMDLHMVPNLIVTDLDGNIDDQLEANKNGSILIVHAHGDNRDIIRKVTPIVPGKISGTIQTDPSGFFYVSNVGGFTDGDRAVFLSDHFGARMMFLIGFDFHGPVGSYSNPKFKNLKVKKKKLLWSEKLINMIQINDRIRFLD